MNPGAEFLLRERAWLQSLVTTLVRDEGEAADLAQDVSLAALVSPPGHDASPRGWLATVARHLAGRRARSVHRRAEREAHVARSESEPATGDVVARAEAYRGVVDAVLALDEPYRSAVLLRFFEDQKPAAIAAQLGCPVATVRTRIARGLAMLRARLERRWGARQGWAALFGLPLAAPAVGAEAVAVSSGAIGMSVQGKVIAAVSSLLLLALGFLAWPSDSLSGSSSDSEPVTLAAAPSDASAPSPASPSTDPAPITPATNQAAAPTTKAPALSRGHRPRVSEAALPKGSGWLVRVVTLDGSPRPDATVWATTGVLVLAALSDGGRLEVGAQGEGATAAARHLATTNSAGYCRIAPPRAGELLVATSGDEASRYLSFDPRAAAPGELLLVLESAMRIEGEVVGGDAPVTGATVSIAREGDAVVATIPTIQGGHFGCLLPAGAGYDVVAASGELQSLWARSRSHHGNLRLELTRGVVVAGRVTDPFQAPLPEATVHAHPVDRESSGIAAADAMLRPVSAVTDAQGQYRLTLFGTATYLFAVRHPGFAPAPVKSVRMPHPTRLRIEQQMQLWGKMVGSVHTTEGRPVVGGQIRVQVARDSVAEFHRLFRPAVPATEWTTVTDAFGNYEVNQLLAACAYDVSCIPDPRRPEDAIVRHGVPAAMQSFVIDRKVEAVAQLRVRVQRADGEVYVGPAELRLHRAKSGPPWRTETLGVQVGSDGVLSLTGLRVGEQCALDLLTAGVGCATLEPLVVAAGGEVTVRFEPRRRVRVEAPLGGTEVIANREGRPAEVPLQVGPLRLDRDGEGEFVDLTPGYWRFVGTHPSAPGREFKSAALDLRTDASGEVVLR